ncbi:hypothetical protein CI109_106345 [Kwoniella shandongensis]|uniref:Uncharacterized protein n=1 Tax=Kwoniella shandongensis TaxID=1734106 RepID=A0A5M6BMV5_9TREE|nr:uncharacterized protein CI109_007454 [Kwoniella shandongensis]KAA5524214.1 hypothetical protein CI109_007454 [Kwoniella shandongensis]
MSHSHSPSPRHPALSKLPLPAPGPQSELPEGTVRPWLPTETTQSSDENSPDGKSTNASVNPYPAPPPGMGYLPVPELTCLHCLGANPPGKLGYVVSYIPVPSSQIQSAEQAYSGIGQTQPRTQAQRQPQAQAQAQAPVQTSRGRTGGVNGAGNAHRAVSQDRLINGVWQNALGYEQAQRDRSTRRERSESQKRYIPEDVETDADEIVE